MLLQEPVFFLDHKWRISEETCLVILRLLRENSMRRSMSKSSTRKDYLLRYLRSPVKSTFKCLCKQTPHWCVIMSKTPQESWRSRWPQERDVEQSALTHACHTHCASRQLGTIADWRFDIPWDWLWDACQMARVHWGTRCKGFCCKGGLHYQIEQSARNPLEHNKCQECLGNRPEAVIRQVTISLYSWVWKSLGGSLSELYCVDLAEAYVRWGSVSSRILLRKKGMICNCPMDDRMRNLWQKAEQGKDTGTTSCTCTRPVGQPQVDTQG